MELCDVIQKVRKERGITQTELSLKVNRSLRIIQKYESGEVEPGWRVLNDISNVLGFDFISFCLDSNPSNKNRPVEMSPGLVKKIVDGLVLDKKLDSASLTEEELEFMSDLLKNLIVEQTKYFTRKSNKKSVETTDMF